MSDPVSGRIGDADRAFVPSGSSPQAVSPVPASIPCAWQPIETAPKDGSVFLTYLPRYRADNGDPIEAAYDFANWDDEYGDFIQHGCGWYRTTHWMPLPEPPQ